MSQVRRHLTHAAVAIVSTTGAIAIVPGLATAAPTGQLRLVVTQTKPSAIGVSNVLTVRVQNIGSSEWRPGIAGVGATVRLLNDNTVEIGSVPRTSNGWRCLSETLLSSCSLQHAIPAGGYSLPIETEVRPHYRSVREGTFTISGDETAEGEETSEGSNALDLPLVDAAGVAIPESVRLTWSEDGEQDPPRNPVIEGLGGTQAAVNGGTYDIGFTVTSATDISTGPFSPILDCECGGPKPHDPTPRFYDGREGSFPTPQLRITAPTAQVDVLSITGYAPKAEDITEVDSEIDYEYGLARAATSVAAGSLTDAPQLTESAIDPASFATETGSGVYDVKLPEQARFLPENPVRIVMRVRLKPGVTAADVLGDVIAPGDPLSAALGRASAAAAPVFTGRYAAHAEVALRVPAPPTLTPTPAPTNEPLNEQAPAPTPNPTPAPVPGPVVAPPTQPQPDEGGRLGEQAGPRLIGRATFGADVIRVGRTTSLTIRITNRGNAQSSNGRACVRLSSRVVVVRLPRGVTATGSQLCIRRGPLGAGRSRTLTSSIVVRGVQTPSASVRDGGNDGVAMTGDQLRIVRGAVRGGGVTG